MSIQYQDFLLEEFRARRSRNTHYSLRAFARDLDMPASKLSQNLRGLCGISVAKAERIATKLHMRDDEKQLFLTLVESQHARSRVARQQAMVSLEKIRNDKTTEMSLEMFSTVRDWFYAAILQMVDIKGFRPDPVWIADRLDLPVVVVHEAILRLENVGLLDTSVAGQWTPKRGFEIPGGVPSRTIREHHKQLLTKAIGALDDCPIEKRASSSNTFAFKREHIGQVRDLLRELQHKILKLSTDSTDNDAVYVLTVQLFPVAESTN